MQPLRQVKPLDYGVFDCSAMAVTRHVQELPRDVVIVEGAYSLHPMLREYYDLRVLVEVEETLQKERILRRNGEQMLRRFLTEWIPLERAYFEACRVKDCCHIIL